MTTSVAPRAETPGVSEALSEVAASAFALGFWIHLGTAGVYLSLGYLPAAGLNLTLAVLYALTFQHVYADMVEVSDGGD